MGKLLKTNLENATDIRAVLQEMEIDFEYEDRSVDTLLIYLPCRSGVCDPSALFDVIKESILTRFVYSCTEIERKLSIRSGRTPEDLFKKAVRKISTHTAKGELGELLLFTLLEVYLNAPKILSKVSRKDSRRMPVFGADAVHAQYHNDDLRLYLGESKLHKSFSGAASKAVDSISKFFENYSDEFELIDTHMDFPDMDDGVREDMLNLLDPFKDENDALKERLYAPCLIGFVEPSLFSDDEAVYLNQYLNIAKVHVGDFFKRMLKKENDIDKTTLILLPFSSLDEVVEGFIDYMGIEE